MIVRELDHTSCGSSVSATEPDDFGATETKPLSQAAQELEQLHTDLRKAQDLLLQNEKLASIGQLAAGVAHELNNPISFIKSNLCALQRYSEAILAYTNRILTLRAQENIKQDDWQNLDRLYHDLDLDYILSEIPSLTKESLSGVERLQQIISDLKSFSRSDGSKRAFTDVRDCIKSAINIVWNEIKYSSELETDFQELPAIECYPQQLVQVFVNLLVNAAQAITTAGQIRIATRLNGERIEISLRDNGKGIPPENVHRIFDPFFTTKEIGQGTGLGLSIVYGIIQRHGGTIRVQSEPGRGTEFIIELPASHEDVQESGKE